MIPAEMSKSSPPPSGNLSKYAPLIHVMQVNPEKLNLIIGPGGKKIKSIIEETGVEFIDTEDDGTVKITGRDLLSIERSKAIISKLTMVPVVGDTFRNCEIKSIVTYGAFVEIAPGREGLCHVSELSTEWLAKAEDAFKVGDIVDVKVIEINEKGQLRLSRRALLPDASPDEAPDKSTPGPSVGNDEVLKPKSSPQRASSPTDNSTEKIKVTKRYVNSSKDISNSSKQKPKKSSSKVTSSPSEKTETTLVNEEAKMG